MVEIVGFEEDFIEESSVPEHALFLADFVCFVDFGFRISWIEDLAMAAVVVTFSTAFTVFVGFIVGFGVGIVGFACCFVASSSC